MFKKKIISTAILAAMGTVTLPHQSYAAETIVDEDVEIIQVTGIRGSLQRSMDVKRDSSGIVDAISAEDMGKFPDTNLAESLQRITGVSIDRAGGEGSRVTVRGFGPANNLITINGRQLPNTTGDRTFDFANVASESVSGVQVYKTSDASVTSGGIGATINLTTNRPLNSPGIKASFGVKAVDDQSTDEGSITPEVSGLYSQTFGDDKFGISISGSYQDRESGMQQFIQDQGYRASDYTNTGWGGVPAGAEGGANRPTSGIYSNPQQPRYVFEERQRERVNGQLVFQYQPVENITATLDYTTFRTTVEEQHTDASVWFNYAGDRSESVWAGEPNAYPLIYSEIYDIQSDADYRDTSLTVGSWGREEKTDSLGFNLEWAVSDQLNLEFDHHSSKASMKATDPRHGTRNNIQLPSYTRSRSGLDLTGDLPGIAIGNIENFNPSTMRLSGSWFANDKYDSEIDQTQISGKYFFDDSLSIDFGVAVNKVNNHYRHTQVQRPDWGGVGVEGDLSGMFFDLQIGLRYEKTDVFSKATAPGYSRVEWNEDTATSVTGVTGIETLSQSADYSQFLPNINFNIEIVEDVMIRAAASKTISRAGYGQLQGGTTINTGGSLSGYSGGSGNPGLKPLESINYDLSSEWYYGEGSYISFGYFKKDVTNWITTGTIDSNIFNLADPLNGEKFRAATAALGANASNEDIRTYIFENFADDPNVQPKFDEDGELDGGTIVGDPDSDDPINFRINVPVNGDQEYTIDGFEFNIQHLFGESGFGGIFNYTMVDSGLEYDNDSLEDTEALVGLSDTANVVFFYDKEGLQARIAYNWRDSFLNERRVNGDLTAPIYTDEYYQIDFNVSYEVPAVEGLTVFIEGINITDEYVTSYGRKQQLIYNITQTGSRYGLGVRYNF